MNVTVAVSALLLVSAGLIPAALVARDWLEVVFLAPLVTALAAAAAAGASTVTRTPLLPWFLVIAVAAAVVPIRLGARPRLRDSPLPTAAALVVLLAAVAPIAGLVAAADAGWDARSIWFLHARWFFGGGSYAWQAMGNAAYLFAHPDYPPLVPGAVAAVWATNGTIDIRAAQVTVVVLNVCAMGMVGLALARVGHRHAPLLSAVVAATVILAGWGLAGTYGWNGYVDLTWAALAVGASLHLLTLPVSRHDRLLGVGLAVCAALTKNEAIPVVLFLLLVAAVRHRHLTPALAALVPVAWTLLARAAGARSDLFGGALPPGAPKAGPGGAWDRVHPSFDAVRHWLADPFVAATLVTLGGFVLWRSARRAADVGSPWSPWALFAVMTVALVVAYALSPYDLAWHLGTSVERTTIAPRLLLYTEIAVWMICGADGFAQRRRATTMPSRS